MELYNRRYSEQGEPLVILHGLFGNNGNWAWQARELSAEYAVVGLDLRNHGRSDWDDAHNYPAMAADVLETLAALGLAQVHMLGHSMGGKVAMEFTLRYPHRVKSLTVVDIAPVAYPADDYPPLIALNAVDLPTLKDRRQAAEILGGVLHRQEVIDFLLTSLHKTRAGEYRWRFNLSALTTHYTDIRDWQIHANSYQGPTLFVKGSESAYVEETARDNIIQQFPHAGLKIIRGAGHWLHSEKPRAFLKIVQDFLSEV